MTRTTRTATRGTGRSSVIFDRAASGNVDPDHGASSRIDEWSLGPFGICDYDGPETVRLRKYSTGTHLILEEIGVETGVTSREVIWTKNKAKLFRYLRSDERPGEVVGRRRSVPLLLTYGFVLKPYVLDLVPGNSLVEYLVGEGFDVYMLDLGISDAEDADLSVEDLVLDYVHGAVQKVLEISGADEISLFGQSQGGTLCAMYTSLFPRGPLKNLVLLSAPTEFAPRNPGLLGLWTIASRSSGAYFDPAIVSKIFGNLPTDLASQIISSIASQQATVVGIAARPFGRGFDVYDAVLRSLRDLADRDVSVRSWLAVSKWVDDAAPFPGEIFRRWVRDFYQRDKLVKGEVKLPRWLLRLFDATAGDLAEWSEFDDAEECYTGILSLAKVGWDTNSEEARMGLSRYKVAPGVAVSDMDRARDFYEEKLGLSVRIDSGDNVQYRCGEGTMFHVYLSPEHAGNSTATLAGWGVDDIERVVDELASKGVVFERYDEGPIITNEKGIATFERDAKVAYFKDPDGNTLSIAQAPRS